MTLKPKVTLKRKGEHTEVALRQLKVILRWTSGVDLDLMAFYKAKDGRTGAVFSDGYPGGSLGSLNAFPFIKLSGDEGVGATEGDDEETLFIVQLDPFAEIYIVTLNYTDAVNDKQSSFGEYDGTVSVVNDKDETIEVPLNARERGHVAVVAKIDNTSATGAKLVNLNEIQSLETFVTQIPGARQITQ